MDSKSDHSLFVGSYLYHPGLSVVFGFFSSFLFHTPDYCAAKACLSERELLILGRGISGEVLE